MDGRNVMPVTFDKFATATKCSPHTDAQSEFAMVDSRTSSSGN